MVTSTDDRALPIKIDSTSNGKFRPVRLSKTLTQANMLAREWIHVHAKRLGVSRRSFLRSLCAAATSLGTLNEAFAAEGKTGGGFRLPKDPPRVRGSLGRTRRPASLTRRFIRRSIMASRSSVVLTIVLWPQRPTKSCVRRGQRSS
jgi:hypothetical protein